MEQSWKVKRKETNTGDKQNYRDRQNIHISEFLKFLKEQNHNKYTATSIFVKHFQNSFD